MRHEKFFTPMGYIHMEPMDEIAGFQVRPGMYELNGATALPGGVNFTVHSFGAVSCELLLFHRMEDEPYAVIPFPEHYRVGPSENEAGDPKEFFTENVNDLLDTLIERTARKFGQAPQTLSKEEKIQFIAELEAKDVFIITNSSKRICSLLGISKYTFYNYLDIVRKQREPYEKGKMED